MGRTTGRLHLDSRELAKQVGSIGVEWAQGPVAKVFGPEGAVEGVSLHEEERG